LALSFASSIGIAYAADTIENPTIEDVDGYLNNNDEMTYEEDDSLVEDDSLTSTDDESQFITPEVPEDDADDEYYEIYDMSIELLSLDPIEQFVARLYLYVLGRGHDVSGLNYWTNHLRNQTRNGGVVAYGFFFSREFLDSNVSNIEFLNILYRTFLNRGPDAAGHAYWLNQLNMGVPRITVFAGFANSVEFDELCRQAGIVRGWFTPTPASRTEMVRAFVTRFYRLALQREPDTAGLNNWTNALVAGQATGASVAHGFIFSTEMNNRNLTDRQFVEILYNTLLGRGSDAAGMNNWLNQLQTGASRHSVFVGFVMSQEFALICRNHGITRGTPPPAPPTHTPPQQPPASSNALVGRVIVLDAGHGTVGSPGWAGYNEAVAMMDLARRLRPLLEAQGATVRFTRNGDANIPLPDRAAMINIWALEMVRGTRTNAAEIAEINRLIGVMQSIIGNPTRANELMNVNPFNAARTIHPELRRVFEITSDPIIRNNFLVISLHSNATAAPVNTAVRGSEVYFIDPNAHANTRTYFTGYSFVNDSRTFGDILMNHIAAAGIPRRAGGLRAANYAIIREINVPAVLAENGFHTNDQDRALLANPAWRQTLAAHYTNAILQYFAGR